VLAKYTYFSNMPTTDQFTSTGSASQFIQRSHVASLDVSYDLTPEWSVGGKYAFRRGEVSLDRVDPDFFSNNAHLYILRTDYRFLKNWEVLAEGRMLHLPDLDERRTGALVSISRYLGDHFKVGIGYNFTDFSEDLTDLSYDHHGFFLNFTGSL
jgi:predicted porin